VTFESIHHNPRNKHYHIKADGKLFHSDIEALAHITSRLKKSTSINKPTMDDKDQRLSDYLARKGFLELCMKGVDTDDDWKTEPEKTFQQLCDQMCQWIEQNYDEIHLGYTGGTDSDTIAEAFLRRDTRNITLVNAANIPVHKKINSRKWLAQHTSEAVKVKYAHAMANLGWKVMMFQGWQPTDINQYEKSLMEREFLSWNNDYRKIHAWAQNSGEVTLTRHNKKSCWIVGLEKPHFTLHKGWYCFQMAHDLTNTPLSCVDPNHDLIYFWLNDIVPDLIKKMSHAKCKEIKKIFKDTRMVPTKKTVEHMSGGSSPYHERINKAMGLGGLTKFLMTADTHRGGKFYAMDYVQQNDIIMNDKRLSDKILLRDRYFDEVIANQVHSELLNLDLRSTMPIYSKPIPIMSVQ
jgi:hypothetical protein